MHSAIVVVRMPQDTQDGRTRWRNFCADVVSLDTNPASKRLGENVWQVDFQQSPAALALLVSESAQHELHYGILPLADAPQWLPAGFDPRPT
jgi:hypothetical protein